MSETKAPVWQRRALSPAQAFALAVARHRAGRLDEAEQLYRAVLKIQPDHVEALTNLGNALYTRGNSTEAVVQYERALALRPDAPEHRH